MILELMMSGALLGQGQPPASTPAPVAPLATPTPPAGADTIPAPLEPPLADGAQAVQPPRTPGVPGEAPRRARAPMARQADRRPGDGPVVAQPGMPPHPPGQSFFGGRASAPAQGGPGWVGPADVARAQSVYSTAAGAYGFARAMDPKEAELDRKARELAGNMHREQDAAKKATLKIELQTVVAQQFQMRQQRRMEDLTRLEDEVKKLRDAMEKREKSKDAIISKRVSELTGEDDIGF